MVFCAPVERYPRMARCYQVTHCSRVTLNYLKVHCPTPLLTIIPYLAFLIPLFSAYRLAKFNIDKRQTRSFLGLPTPANGLFWVGYCQGIHTLLPIGGQALLYITLGFLILLTP